MELSQSLSQIHSISQPHFSDLPKKRTGLDDLPQCVLDDALIPQLRKADVMFAVAQTATRFHQASMRTAISNHLKNIHLWLHTVTPEPAQEQDSTPSAAKAALPPFCTSTTSAAARSVYRMNQLLMDRLKPGALQTLSPQACSAERLWDAAEKVCKNAHRVLGARSPLPLTPSERLELSELQNSLILLGNKLREDLYKELDPWVLQELQTGGNSMEARDRIVRAILGPRARLELPALGLSSLPHLGSCLPNLSSLNLEMNNFAEVPATVAELVNLQDLNLAYNHLSSTPSSLQSLDTLTKIEKLKDLNLSANDFTRWPFSISQLSALEGLTFKNNPQRPLVGDLSKLMSLKTLVLDLPRHQDFLPEICELKNLTTLKLRGNGIRRLPPQIAQLKKLENICIYSKRLTTLPDNFGDMRLLKAASFHMPITSLPDTFKNLKHLKTLDLSDTAIGQLPELFCELNSLKVLRCKTPADSLPIRIPWKVRIRHDLKIDLGP